MPTTKVIDDIEIAARALRDGLLVAFPTETVYGLGVDATNSLAVQRLFLAKGRPADNPLIVHLGDRNQISQVAQSIDSSAEKLLHRFAPGPITLVVKKNSTIVDSVTAGLDSVGIRIPDAPQARELLSLVDRPVAAPSANLSGRPSCTTWQSVYDDLNGKIDYILKGEFSRIGIESTVVDCSCTPPVLLRMGAVTLEQLRIVLPDIECWQANSQQACSVGKHAIPSPGLRHAHYQPKARLRLVTSIVEAEDLRRQNALAGKESSFAFLGLDSSNAFQGAEEKLDQWSSEFHWDMNVRYGSVEEYAMKFYESMREADRRGISVIFVQLAPDNHLGSALRDRQFRAAGIQP